MPPQHGTQRVSSEASTARISSSEPLTILSLAHAIQSVNGKTSLGIIDQKLGLGPAIGHMDLEVGQDIAVDLQGVNDLVLMRGVIQPVARGCDESLKTELVGVEQETDERF